MFMREEGRWNYLDRERTDNSLKNSTQQKHPKTQPHQPGKKNQIFTNPKTKKQIFFTCS
jgi:hypothetical protein